MSFSENIFTMVEENFEFRSSEIPQNEPFKRVEEIVGDQ